MEGASARWGVTSWLGARDGGGGVSSPEARRFYAFAEARVIAGRTRMCVMHDDLEEQLKWPR